MTNNAVKFHSLSRRIMAQFCIFTLVLSAIYGVLAFLLLYNLEDTFIERDIAKEADYIIEQYQQNQQWPDMRDGHYTLHFSKDTLPADMRSQSLNEPQRKEFYGEQGRHYHLYPLPNFQNIYLLAQVSDMLLVRPVREGVVKLLLISALSLTVIAFIIAWLLGRKTAKPLKELANLVDGVAPENIPHTFADKFPRNEIGILARTLEHSMQQISKALERERCFTRDVSHELRTPVAIIKNAVEVFHQQKQQINSLEQADDAHNEAKNETAKIMSRIEAAAMQMEQTVTTLLHLAREEHAFAQSSSVELLPLIEQSIIDHSYLLNGKSVEVEVNDNCAVELITQKGMVKVLLDNLLSYAFQYTEQGFVSISFTEKTLTIEDTGPGIAEDISDQITEPAVKGSQSTGYGFGLSIVKRLCEHQKWQFSVDSNQGTRISVTFV